MAAAKLAQAIATAASPQLPVSRRCCQSWPRDEAGRLHALLWYTGRQTLSTLLKYATVHEGSSQAGPLPEQCDTTFSLYTLGITDAATSLEDPPTPHLTETMTSKCRIFSYY